MKNFREIVQKNLCLCNGISIASSAAFFYSLIHKICYSMFIFRIFNGIFMWFHVITFKLHALVNVKMPFYVYLITLLWKFWSQRSYGIIRFSICLKYLQLHWEWHNNVGDTWRCVQHFVCSLLFTCSPISTNFSRCCWCCYLLTALLCQVYFSVKFKMTNFHVP